MAAALPARKPHACSSAAVAVPVAWLNLAPGLDAALKAYLPLDNAAAYFALYLAAPYLLRLLPHPDGAAARSATGHGLSPWRWRCWLLVLLATSATVMVCFDYWTSAATHAYCAADASFLALVAVDLRDHVSAESAPLRSSTRTSRLPPRS